LSIIDLAAGGQPMSNEDESIWITFNGELYNYKELQAELKKLGYTFKTNSDTEVIIYAYQQWNVNCLKRFRGMFSFGIVDLNKKEIFLARDHFGIKPLYIYQTETSVAFGSELQQFKKLPDFKKEIDINALDQYLWLQYIPAPLTIFKSIKKIKPAHYLTISFNGTISKQIPYWDVDFSKKKIKTENEWLEETDFAIKDSVKAHLVADVPFGAFLSGGIDSSLVVEYMSKQLKKPIETFSIGFEEEEYNELKYAEVVAKKWNTNHHIEIVKPDALGILPKLVKHYGEPYGDSSCIPTYYVCELAKKHVTMVLSGDGGDECFAGYSSYINWLKFMPIQYRTGIKKTIYPYLEKLMPSRYPKKDTLDYWLQHINYLDKNWRTKLWKEEYQNQMSTNPEGFEELFNKTANLSLSNKVQYMDMKTYMNNDILTKVDIASMIHSLEVRTPLIDKEVWELAATIPEEFNINNKSGEWRGKLLLKKLMEKNFPENFVYRKKQGFAVPLSKWFANEGEYRQVLEEKLLSEKSLLRQYFNKNGISDLIQSQHTGGLWLLLFLEEWLHQFND
ncbi:MAG: asparagine synthase (glutamine-hydrolyzing), partial [Bacteroidia bacterium]